MAWVAGDYIYFGGGSSSGNRLQSIEKYSPISKTWSFVDTLPQAVDDAGTAVANNRIFIVSGRLGIQLGPTKSTQLIFLQIEICISVQLLGSQIKNLIPFLLAEH